MNNLITLLILSLLPIFSSCQNNSDYLKNKDYKITRSNQQWREILTPLEYHVLRNAGTEKPYTGLYDKHYEKGVYSCKGCDEELYKSENKYNSNCGWPSFDNAIDNKIEYGIDYKIGYPRIELKCKNCGSHLGHMFDDGPKDTTGKRHCINSVALNFKPI